MVNEILWITWNELGEKWNSTHIASIHIKRDILDANQFNFYLRLKKTLLYEQFKIIEINQLKLQRFSIPFFLKQVAFYVDICFYLNFIR